ncbi:amylo-alpha-1,6-glucosidase [Photobacterium atrarenae]|uniref:Amylo-alpha-1,6-glucosidase n=1 Tax=Photobacterium atrarenae TaxID=865757 RepID=A0ABY5GKM9_9GAMM|nr:amylo-alpha-1,6-glucosidase [Photobacterium atrarenae]UTV29869.1 amylo-alpha-1,6-glucosidase [Photobacterium atrarenae]
MNGLTAMPYSETLYVKGTFNGWGNDTPMHYMGAGQYQAVICLPADQHSFKISDQAGSEHLTFSADKYKAVPCSVDNAQTLVPAKGIGNDLTFLAPATGLYTLTLTVADAQAPSLLIGLGGENRDAALERALFSGKFQIMAGQAALQGKAAPVLAPAELFRQLTICETASAPFVFGDNVDGYYEGSTHGFVAAGKYRHQQGWYLGTFASFIDGQIQDKTTASQADILPYGVTHHFESGVSDTLMLLSRQRAAALTVRATEPTTLAIASQLNLAINASTVKAFEGGVVYALAPELRQEATPSFIAITANRPFRCREVTFAEVPALNEVVHLSGSHVKPMIESLSPETQMTVYLTFARSEDEAVAAAQALVAEDGYTRHQQQVYDMLTRSYLWTSDMDYNRALMWAKASAKVFVSNEYGKGIWAGLPWFKDCWGRDSFIALSGTCLVNGDYDDARAILDNFAAMQQTDETDINFGRVPNRVTSLTNRIYNTTDGTPWLVREVWDYLRYSGDAAYAQAIYPVVQTYIAGIEKNYLDPHGLMTHRDPDTWMDAKLEGKLPWSARGNRANDIQALWYTSLKVAVELARLNDDHDGELHYQQLADRVQASFQALFWDTDQEMLADRLHADNSRDLQVRPNQLMVLTVPFEGDLLERAIGAKVVKNAVSELLFPWGITSLSQSDPHFHPYHANRAEYHKDAAYHNGTIWGWNAGFTVSSLTDYGYSDFAYQLTQSLSRQILTLGHRGTMSENLDAFLTEQGELTTTGTYAQAWSVSEFTRNGYQDYLGFQPDLMAGQLTLAPCVPSAWQTFDAVVGFGPEQPEQQALQVRFQRRETQQVYQLQLSEPATASRAEQLALILTGVNCAKYQLLLPVGNEPVTVTFDSETAAAEVDGQDVALTILEPGYQAEIGELRFAEPEIERTFPVLQSPHYLQGLVESCDLAQATD